MSPKIFVGTLYSGESEFQDCCKAIKDQQEVIIKHKVISNKPEYEAHNLLWEEWEKSKLDYDLFVKIDADTVLNSDSALFRISKLFHDIKITGAQILLHDYFTEDLIAGLNVFSKKVIFKPSRRKLFADHADKQNTNVLKGDSVRHLNPIGFHCINPNEKQSFHYGFHRALKGQNKIIKRCAEVWLDKKDNARAWALAGAMSKKWYLRRNTDYGDHRFEYLFKELKCKDRLIKEVEFYANKILSK